MYPNSVFIDKLGPKLNVSIRYSDRAKRINIRIKLDIDLNTKIELVVPNNDLENAHRFLLKKESWIRKKLQNIAIPIKISDPNIIPIFDKKYSIKYISSELDQVKKFDNEIHVLSLPNNSRSILIEFLEKLLLEKVKEFIDAVNKYNNFTYSKIKIINSKRRWGSCSNKGVLSFNWRLVFTQDEIINYVVIHELCHLVEMNHSKKFWHLVEGLCPNYKARRLWLKDNSFILYSLLID